MDAKADLMALHPAGRSLAFGQDGIFLDKLVGYVSEGRLGLGLLGRGGQDTDRGLPVEAEIPVLRHLYSLFEGFGLGAMAVIMPVQEGCRLPKRAAVAAEDIGSAAENGMVVLCGN